VVKQNRPTEEAYAELQYAYDFYNKELFDGQLTSCLLTYQRSKRTFGYFSKDRFGHRDARKTHELALNPEYFAVVPLIEVLQTLVHEMTHLWQEHFGKSTLASLAARAITTCNGPKKWKRSALCRPAQDCRAASVLDNRLLTT
jgi:hypothetical protein